MSSLCQEIEAAASLESLGGLGPRLFEVLRAAGRPGADLKTMMPQISRLNEAVTLRLIALLESTEGVRLPEGATYLVLGSEGRGDQALRTDQDSAMVFVDDLPPDRLPEIERFATRLVAALAVIGVPRCPGDVMASNPQWRHSLSAWKRLLDQWIEVPTPENILKFGIFQGLRALHGVKGLEGQLHEHLLRAVRRPTPFFPHMALHALRFPPPLSMFGRIRVERSGERRGKVDLKKAGIFTLTVGISLLALEAGCVGGNTWEKLGLLGRLEVLAPEDLISLEGAFTFLVQCRLRWGLRELEATGQYTNHVDPLAMSDLERHQLRQALKGVTIFRRFLHNRYQLNFVTH